MSESNEQSRRIRELIDSFSEIRCRQTDRLKTAVDDLLPAFLESRQTWAKSQRKSADDFNLFEVIEADSDEVCHSKVLAWLLDHRIEYGTHAQGELGFRLFLEELEVELRKGRKGQVVTYADERNYWVRREVSGDEARVDIEIAASGKFLIHIENKILSPEGDYQTDREWSDMQARAKELGVPEPNCHAIFLTLDGSDANNKNFRSVAWNRIARVFDRFATLAEPAEVKLFVRHYAKAVRKLSAAVTEEVEAEDVIVQ